MRLLLFTFFLLTAAGCSSRLTPVAPSAATGTATATVSATGLSKPASQASASTLAHYTDPATGVSLDYPDIWKPTSTEANYLPNSLDEIWKLKTSFNFSPKGNLYESTNLSGLSFDFATRQGTSLALCAKAAQGASTDVPAHPVSFHGVPFQEFGASDAGMCHRVANTVDIAYRDGQCLAFSRDFRTICPDVAPGEKTLTPTQTKALRRHLDEIMQSVRIQ